MPTQSPSADIRAALLKRIITHIGSKELVLYEGKIAQEFGVSRTPIRQVLQSMASEWLVEVKSGVGTVATPLLKERRRQDYDAFMALLRAASAACADAKLSAIAIDLTTARLHLEQVTDQPDNELFFDAAERFAKSMEDLVGDDILENALISSYWRFIRRRIADFEGDFKQARAELVRLIKDAEYAAQKGDVERVLLMIRTTVQEILNQSDASEPS